MFPKTLKKMIHQTHKCQKVLNNETLALHQCKRMDAFVFKFLWKREQTSNETFKMLTKAMRSLKTVRKNLWVRCNVLYNGGVFGELESKWGIHDRYFFESQVSNTRVAAVSQIKVWRLSVRVCTDLAPCSLSISTLDGAQRSQINAWRVSLRICTDSVPCSPSVSTLMGAWGLKTKVWRVSVRAFADSSP